MSEREKIITEFVHLINAAKGNYQDFVDLTVEGGEEILALLRELEAEKPIKYCNLTMCPKCYSGLFKGQKCCHQCGKHILWEELVK